MEVNDGAGLNALMQIEGDSDTIAAWSDEKKQGFCKLFQTRVEDSRAILILTAQEVFGAAKRRYFVPSAASFQERTFQDRGGPIRCHDRDGREYNELRRIAEERAKIIIKELPVARKAVEVIDAETAKKMLRVEKINEQLGPLQEEFEGLSQEVRLSEVPQDWTVGALRKFIADEVKKRKDLTDKINGLSREGQKLEEEIAKALYKGLPGLKEAVVKVVVAHLERADHLGTVSRRVEERVLYGDSAAALDLLKSFEQDEVTVSEEVRAELRSAVASLGVGKAPKKAKAKKKAPRRIEA